MLQTTKVIVADDQLLVRAGIVSILEDLGGFECIAAVADGSHCIKACAETPPDILLLDLDMPGSSGLDVTRVIRKAHPEVRVLILTSSTDASLANQAIGLGAAGFVSKDFVMAELAMALQCVREGRVYLSPDIALSAVRDKNASDRLTPRQKDVLRFLAKGLSNKEIAREMAVSIKTVEYHRAELIQRLDLHDVASLTRFALVHGLAD